MKVARLLSTVNHLLATLLILHSSFLFAGAQTLNATPSELTQDSVNTPLKVLSYNIHMLPPLAKFTGKQRRAKRIGDLLKDSDFDIVVFQEAFHAAARRKIKRRMRDNYPFELGPANQRWYSFKTNSGIWMLSKIPLKNIAEIDYDYCEGIDCWARKGALVAEGKFNEKPFQILGTHLEAGGGKAMKVTQYEELDSILRQVRRPNVVQIAAGDFNTHKFNDPEQYAKLMNTLTGFEDGPLLSEQKFTSDSYINDIKIKRGDKKKQRVIDFVLVNLNGNTLSVNRYVRMPQWQWSKDRKDLSDHFAVEAQIRIE